MFIPEKEFLFLFGWDDFFENQIPSLAIQDSECLSSKSFLFPARVVCEERNLYRIQAGKNFIFWASVSGKMQFNALSRVDYPAVGDWVLVDHAAYSDRGIIHHVLKRKTIIHRRQVGPNPDMQILSTNVDYTFITTSVNFDLNFRRIERYLAVARDAGTTPIILLTKADTCAENLTDVLTEVQREFPDVHVHTLSKENFESAEFLRSYIREGTTSIFIGSSGVGKSTLVNFLIGEEKAETQDIRENDSKGRHTTTSRNLYVSRYGGLIIDTPGMRELQLSDHSEGLSSHFPDVEELISQCRFADCQHETEPSCAIQNALADESLSEERWRSYQKLNAEIRHNLRKQDKGLAAEDRKVWKKMSQNARKKNKSTGGL